MLPVSALCLCSTGRCNSPSKKLRRKTHKLCSICQPEGGKEGEVKGRGVRDGGRGEGSKGEGRADGYLCVCVCDRESMRLLHGILDPRTFRNNITPPGINENKVIFVTGGKLKI
jgi:hypothetical protein